MVSPVARRAVPVTPPEISGDQPVEEPDEVRLAAGTGLDESEPGGRVRYEN